MTVTDSTQDAVTRAAVRQARTASARQRASRAGFGVLGALIVLAIWYTVALSEVFGSGLVPRPDEIAEAGWAGFSSDGMLFDVRVSITRVLIGVALGAALAVPVGFLLAWYPRLRATFDPLVNFFRALPPIALIPLFIVWFGIGETARISLLIYAAFFASVVVLYEGISSLDPLLIRAARVLGANSWEVFAKCIVPAAVPHLFTGLRVAFGVSWATLVAAELIAANRGLGAVIQDARTFFQVSDIYVGIVLIGLSALVMDYLLRVVQRYATRWQERTQR
jgi:NitT/TauT family transport system permease protein